MAHLKDQSAEQLKAQADARIEVLTRLGLLRLADAPAPLHRDVGTRGPHVLSLHRPIWHFCNPKFAQDKLFFPNGRPVFGFPRPGATLDELFADTDWAVFLGAADSDLFRRVLARPGVVCLVFEPSPERFAEFAASLDLRALPAKPFFFVGDHDALGAPLMELLPKELADQGHPVFFVQEGLSADAAYQDALIEKLEFFYYRHAIYQLEGHWGRSGLPSRDICRSLFHDQQTHLYENIPDYLTRGTINDLAGAFANQTALLVTGGPDLDSKIEYVRANTDKAVVICVNTALRTLLAHGIRPHFVVINDTSHEAAATLAGLGALESTALVAHAVSGTGGGAFRRVFFFGNVLPELFEVIPMLRLHGSVASTALSLAKHMGCARAVYVGLQMAGTNPWHMGYSQKTLQAGQVTDPQDAPTGAFPQLYPVLGPDGQRMYTTLNFFDATLWLLDEIAASGMEVVNTARDTIVHGRGVRIDPDYAIPSGGDIEALSKAIRPVPLKANPAKVHEYVLGQIEFWRLVKKMAAEDLGLADAPDFPRRFAAHLDAWDKANVSFLLERLPGFDIVARFYAGYLSDDPTARREAALAYLGACREMATGFIKLLTDRLRRLLEIVPIKPARRV